MMGSAAKALKEGKWLYTEVAEVHRDTEKKKERSSGVLAAARKIAGALC